MHAFCMWCIHLLHYTTESLPVQSQPKTSPGCKFLSQPYASADKRCHLLHIVIKLLRCHAAGNALSTTPQSMKPMCKIHPRCQTGCPINANPVYKSYYNALQSCSSTAVVPGMRSLRMCAVVGCSAAACSRMVRCTAGRE